MMSFEAAVTFFIAVFIFGITPGPGVFAILARALASGPKACISLALGMTISDILYLIAACFGMAAVATHWGGLFTAVRILGAVYLFYLGWTLWRAPIQIAESIPERNQTKQLLGFIQGFSISASNPKVILFYIAFLPTFIDVSQLAAPDIVLVSMLTLVALMVGLMLIAWFASRARAFFNSERGARRLNQGAGSLMISAGAFLLLKH